MKRKKLKGDRKKEKGVFTCHQAMEEGCCLGTRVASQLLLQQTPRVLGVQWVPSTSFVFVLFLQGRMPLLHPGHSYSSES